ncbi:MAG: hypothetical protein ACREA9_07755 [Pyrinomonadaceae bacterium]
MKNLKILCSLGVSAFGRARFPASALGMLAFYLLLFAPSLFAQSVAGLNAPDKIKSASDVPVQVKAARGEAPLSKLYSHLRVDPENIKRLPFLPARQKVKEVSEKILRIGVVRPLTQPLSPLTDGALYRTGESDARASILKQQETNKAFVLMQYFGYLRRNPDDAPEQGLNFDGYNFWLGKLNQFNGNFVNAEMVKAFLVSGEYRQRFGP